MLFQLPDVHAIIKNEFSSPEINSLKKIKAGRRKRKWSQTKDGIKKGAFRTTYNNTNCMVKEINCEFVNRTQNAIWDILSIWSKQFNAVNNFRIYTILLAANRNSWRELCCRKPENYEIWFECKIFNFNQITKRIGI